jgi:hypothetical protein
VAEDSEVIWGANPEKQIQQDVLHEWLRARALVEERKQRAEPLREWESEELSVDCGEDVRKDLRASDRRESLLRVAMDAEDESEDERRGIEDGGRIGAGQSRGRKKRKNSLRTIPRDDDMEVALDRGLDRVGLDCPTVGQKRVERNSPFSQRR